MAETDLEPFQKKLSAALAANVKTKEPLFKKVRIGGRKKGCYGLYAKVMKPARVRLTLDEVKASTSFLGKAGEYALFSELLFRGFNASIMTVDDGVDIIASKSHRFFYLQVKTSSDNSSTFGFTIKKSAFEQHLNGTTFYVLVVRRTLADRHLCDFVILPSSQIGQMILRGAVVGNISYSLKLNIAETGQFLLNRTEDVTAQVNRFNQIV
ncbi:MAG: hypothetical protein JWO89_3795 [Verrucomicrobiaceae bacterium]|nr:hypothetical protein [Verrucomicrobiaceae bacterium]